MSVLILFGAAQGAFLALVLARLKKGHRTANRFLACLLFIFSIGLVEGFLSVTYLSVKLPSLIGIDWPLIFLYGPLVYFYVKALTEPHWRIQSWKLYAHFVPVLLLYIYLIPLFLADPEFKVSAWLEENGHLKNYTPVVDPILFVAIIQIAGYLILSLRLLKFHSRNIQQNFSSIEKISLSWLRTLIFVFFGLLCMYTFSAVFSQFYGVYKEAEYLLNLMIAIAIYIMGYKGITQPDIFTPMDNAGPRLKYDLLPGDDDKKTTPTIIKDIGSQIEFAASGSLPQQSAEETGQTEKYKKSALTDEQSDEILARLTTVMEKEKPYLEMGLTLPMLSRMVDVSPHHLSQVVNEKLDKSFFDFINEYRVQETKKALFSSKAERFSILGIAMDAGFNSKSAFYHAFKRHTGMTPSQFKERHTPSDHSGVQDS